MVENTDLSPRDGERPRRREVSFVRDALDRFAEKRATDEARLAADLLFERFEWHFATVGNDVPDFPDVEGTWQFKQAVIAAITFLNLDLAELGILDAWVAGGLRKRDIPPLDFDVYDRLCDFAMALRNTIGNAMLAERAAFREVEGRVTVH